MIGSKASATLWKVVYQYRAKPGPTSTWTSGEVFVFTADPERCRRRRRDAHRRAFQAFGALPAAAAAPVTRPWWEVLNFPQDWIAGLTPPLIEARFRELALEAHPDRGGSDAAMAELNRAKADALAHLRGPA